MPVATAGSDALTWMQVPPLTYMARASLSTGSRSHLLPVHRRRGGDDGQGAIAEDARSNRRLRPCLCRLPVVSDVRRVAYMISKARYD